MTRWLRRAWCGVVVAALTGCTQTVPPPDPQVHRLGITAMTADAVATYPTVPVNKSPMDSTQRTGSRVITVAAMVRDYDDTWRPSTALVRLWPANAAGDSVAADRRVYDRAAWTTNWQDRGFDIYVWAAFPDSFGVARFPRLPDLPFWVGTAPRASGYPMLAIKPMVARVTGDTLIVMEGR